MEGTSTVTGIVGFGDERFFTGMGSWFLELVLLGTLLLLPEGCWKGTTK